MLFSTLFYGLAAAAPTNSPKVLSLPVVKQNMTQDSVLASKVATKSYAAGTPSEPLTNRVTWYSIYLTFGSQKSVTQLNIDTGSADLIIPYQKFDPSQSTTFQNMSVATTNCYSGGYCFHGYYGKDTLSFDGNELDGCQMVILNDADADYSGLLGVGWTNYNNFPYMMQSQGLIDHVAYSVWLNGASESNGEIIFGGIDTTKFSGSIGIIKNFGNLQVASDGTQTFSDPPTSFQVALTGLSVKDANGAESQVVNDLSYPVIFDTGTTTATLYRDWIVALGYPLGATWDDNINGCVSTNPPTKGSVIFDFSGVQIELPLSELFPRASKDGQDYSVNGEAAYWFSFSAQDSLAVNSPLILGDYFMRWAYVVFDMDNRQLGIAQANHGEFTDSSMVEIGDTIPSATTAPNYDSVTSFHTSFNVNLVSSFAT